MLLRFRSLTQLKKCGYVIAVLWSVFGINLYLQHHLASRSNSIVFDPECFTAFRLANNVHEPGVNRSYAEFGYTANEINPNERPLTCDNCFHQTFNYRNNYGDNICRGNSSSTIYLLLLVLSSPVNTLNRGIIRQSWGKITQKNRSPTIRLVFLLGKHRKLKVNRCVAAESAKYGDIVQADFLDTYSHLTFKTLMGFHWANNFCQQAQFVLKTDDDMWVHPTNLVNVLLTHDLRDTLAGSCFQYEQQLDKGSKWYVHPSMFPEDYPNITVCSGTAYVLPMTLVRDIIAISPNVPFFPLEDVYIGLCMDRLLKSTTVDYSQLSMSGFYNVPAPIKMSLEYACNCVVASHQGNGILEIWTDMEQGGCLFSQTTSRVGSKYCQSIDRMFFQKVEQDKKKQREFLAKFNIHV